MRSEKVEFTNREGLKLAARLELPSTPPHAFAIFAHCFSCSKDMASARTISRSLTDFGLAVLRFDFTGLGNSEGDFANTNFSSNVEDLVCANRFLSENYQPASVLIGHSLGGAAVLSAAVRLPEVRAIATIGAPSDTTHVKHLFECSIDEINEQGVANVKLGGRPFTIKKQFIDDLHEQTVLDKVAELKKALMIFHSPQDDTVSIDHAKKIYVTAKHPKSFVSLDGADHLLGKKEDQTYVAEVLHSWVKRYIPRIEDNSLRLRQANMDGGEVVVKSRPGANFTQDILTKKHHIIADEPKSIKGDDLGGSPYDLLLASLGACTSMTMKMYADRKEWPLEGVEVTLLHKRIHAKDCVDCETEDGMVDQIERRLKVEGPLDETQRKKLLEIADKCPVHRTLHSEIKVRTELI